jgi:DNA-binding response OmpR family regulator
MTIGIISDDELTLKTVATALDHAGIPSMSAAFDTSKEITSLTSDCEVILLLVEQDMERALAICQHCSDEGVPVLVVGNFTREVMQSAFYEAGAADCIARPVSSALMLAKVRAWLRHVHTAEAAAQVAVGVFTLDLMSRVLRVGTSVIPLTPKEARLLAVLMKHPQRLHPSEDLSRVLWPLMHSQTSALRNVVYRLRRKLRTLNPSFEGLIWHNGGYTFLP